MESGIHMDFLLASYEILMIPSASPRTSLRASPRTHEITPVASVRGYERFTVASLSKPDWLRTVYRRLRMDSYDF